MLMNGFVVQLSTLAFLGAGVALMFSAHHPPLKWLCIRLLLVGAFLVMAASFIGDA